MIDREERVTAVDVAAKTIESGEPLDRRVVGPWVRYTIEHTSQARRNVRDRSVPREFWSQLDLARRWPRERPW
jgi:hypothetical protein